VRSRYPGLPPGAVCSSLQAGVPTAPARVLGGLLLRTMLPMLMRGAGLCAWGRPLHPGPCSWRRRTLVEDPRPSLERHGRATGPTSPGARVWLRRSRLGVVLGRRQVRRGTACCRRRRRHKHGEHGDAAWVAAPQRVRRGQRARAPAARAPRRSPPDAPGQEPCRTHVAPHQPRERRWCDALCQGAHPVHGPSGKP
jgi:hypothetical protein